MRNSNAEAAFEDVLLGKNVLVHGEAGTGKSTFIRSITDILGSTTMIIAPTGLAAINVGGQTFHNAFKAPVRNVYDPSDIKNRKHLRELFKTGAVRRIVIDEGGMLTSSAMFFMDKTLQKVMNNRLPFGGVQMIFVADFLQLGCIVPLDQRRAYFDAYGYPEMFMYKEWGRLNVQCHNFTEVFRQQDRVFSEALGRLRLGKTTRSDLDYFNSRVMPNKDSPVICTSNKRAELTNSLCLSKINGFEKEYKATRTGDFKETPVPERIKLKIGAKVVICTNNYSSTEANYVNGDVGYVTDMKNKYIKVDTERLGVVKVEVTTYSKYELKPVPSKTFGNDNNEPELERVVVGTYTQIPVKLFYAGTTHKSQGLTLDKAHVDLEGRVFCEALPYVALSRVRTLEGLSLERPLRFNDIMVNKRCVDFVLK